jgi:N-acetylmuramoyl-L-alanine amidase
MKRHSFRTGFYIRLFCCCILVLCATGAARADSPEHLYNEALKNYKASLSMPPDSKRVETLSQSIQNLHQVLRADTKGEFTDRCYYLFGQCYHLRYDTTQNAGDFQAALENYKTVVRVFPRSPLADDAQYLTGVLMMHRDPAQAYLEFAKVSLYFPKGDMQPKAARMATDLQARLGHKTRKEKPAVAQPSEKHPPVSKSSASVKSASKPSKTALKQEGAREADPARSPSLARQLALDVKRIVLDPGHGGKDKGAIGPNNVYEKDIALAIAKELKKILETRTDCEVFLTRTRDRSMSLEERTAFANARKADLFVSIHVNAHEDRSRCGIETYFLDLSRDNESARVAARENAPAGRKISDLEAIIKDLMQNTKQNESSLLAHEVQSSMVKNLQARHGGLRDLGVKRAPFLVLLGAEMPSILIETAFISNEREELLLKDGNFQKNAAGAIASGIESYMKKMKTFARVGDR